MPDSPRLTFRRATFPSAFGRAVGGPLEGAVATAVALVAFVVEAQFGSFKLMEAPFYVVLLGAGILKLSSATAVPQQWSAVRPVQAPATVRLTQSPSRPLVQPARALDNC